MMAAGVLGRQIRDADVLPARRFKYGEAMEPGRELDALIAEKVMGCSLRYVNTVHGAEVSDCGCADHTHGVTSDAGYTWLKEYSTDISAAWAIVMQIPMTISAPTAPYATGEYKNSSNTEWSVECAQLVPHTDFWCDTVAASATTAPHAICLVALKALGVEPL